MIIGNTASQKQNRRFPGEVISDPLSDTEEEGRTDPQKPHQVHWGFLPIFSSFTYLFLYLIIGHGDDNDDE